MSAVKQKIVVVGGGITGLAAAYRIQKERKLHDLDFEVTLVESSHRLGGKIQTVEKDGFIIEKGPDSYLARKKSMSRLAEEIGFADRLVNNATGQSFVLVNDTLHPMPGGSVMGIPTQVGSFLKTDLFSLTGKVRAAADFVMPKSQGKSDQSLGAFFRRRLGNEVVENLIEPLLSGIYAGDIDRLSLMATFPQFYQVEQEHRSLILGMKKNAPPPAAKVKKKGLFLTFTSGLQSFVDKLEEELISTTVIKGVKVETIEKEDSSPHRYKLLLNNGETLDADSIIFTVPHIVASGIFQKNNLLTSFKSMPATSVATVAMAFPSEAIRKDIEGTGFVVSRNSDYTITACTWTHKKWPHSTPEGKVLLRCYVGRAGDEAVVDLADNQIESIVLDDLKKIMDISEKPEFTIVTRWKQAMPQYTVGHKERLKEEKEKLENAFPGVFIAGSSFEGLGLPDCVDQGESAAHQSIAYVTEGHKGF
ncbi:protoporphyrinogen oxidase [Jeotgalibacillus soli]|uniref:Coproporphyrinogen III oxidase n=1 Tax=Jeotgalibacillus soli TaxID=889306 RepID=A0A0C2VMF2_9BACL|nr:protoporphyrinogen oxidase [Jeotgalibacillus soli]KIL45616.1 protoporphyrinogen oxidase [Jeotgalibacillus soli]